MGSLLYVDCYNEKSRFVHAKRLDKMEMSYLRCKRFLLPVIFFSEPFRRSLPLTCLTAATASRAACAAAKRATGTRKGEQLT
jgi:hypothetical protein